MAGSRQSHHHLRRHRRHPHAVDVAVSAGHARRDRRGGDRRGRGGRRDRPSARARSRRPAGPTRRPRPFARFLPRIKQRTNAVINITTGGAPVHDGRGARPAGGDLQAGGRLAQHGLDELRPVPDAGPLQGLQVRLGDAGISRTRATCVFRNTFKDIEFVLSTCAEQRHALRVRVLRHRPSLQPRHFLERGLVKPPLFVQTVFGILGGIGPHPEDVMHMKRTADRLFGDQYQLVGARRRPQSARRSPRMAAAMGGNVRVGLEDSLWSGPGKLATSNAEQVRAGPADHRGPRPRGRDPRRGARDPRAEGRRPGRASDRSRKGRTRACCGSRLSSTARDSLGEGPLWDVEEQRLYWIDSLGPPVHVCRPQRAASRRTWTCPSRSARWRCASKGGGAVLALDPASISSISTRAR